MKNKALLVGIDHYPTARLFGCVNDAIRMEEILTFHENGFKNFDCKKLVTLKKGDRISRTQLLEAIVELLAYKVDLALFYFAGHGKFNEKLGGYLLTTDSPLYYGGVSMAEIFNLVNQTEVKEVVILLDCCDSGALGDIQTSKNDLVFLKEGVSILTASHRSQPAVEKDGGGIFTELVCEALEGGAADLFGNVTIARLYEYVNQYLGAWDQQPLFKSYVSELRPLRQCKPAVNIEMLRFIYKYFMDPDDEYRLDPSYEPSHAPTSNSPDTEKIEILNHLKSFCNAHLVIPLGDERDLHGVAMHSKSCKLTPMGKLYWKLAKDKKI